MTSLTETLALNAKLAVSGLSNVQRLGAILLTVMAVGFFFQGFLIAGSLAVTLAVGELAIGWWSSRRRGQAAGGATTSRVD